MPDIFLVPKAHSEWLEYSLEVLVCVVRDNKITDFEACWPTKQEMIPATFLREI